MSQDHVTRINIFVEPNLHSPTTWSSTKRGKRDDIRALHAAALKGNWQVAEVLVKKDPTLLHSKLTPGKDTVLHIAATANCSNFVKELVNLGKVDVGFSIDLTLRNINGDTAFTIAACSGFVDIAQIMKEENEKLPNIINDHRDTPLFKAVRGGHKEMARYLFPLTHIDWLHVEDRIRLFVATIISEMYDIALRMLEIDPRLAYARDCMDSKLTALHVLAQKPQDICSGSGVGTSIRYIHSWIYRDAFMPTLAYQLLEKIWKQVLKLEDEEVLQIIRKTPSVLFEAVKSGNVEFLTFLLNSFPYLIWEVDEDDKGLFHAAVANRQEKIFNLICNLGAFKNYTTLHIDKYGNNMLHFAGKLAPLEKLGTSRPHLQMQRELLWFKEVQKIMPPSFINMKNKKGLTPKDLFLKEHKELLVKGETVMKETAHSCMLVSTLISTIVFAAVLTVPGSSKTTSPQTLIFHKETWFMIFVVSNAVALFSSSTSTILLLSILTSRFVESEYISSLQAKMMCGLTALFISITTMVIAFTAATFLIYDCKPTRVPYFIASLASVPIILFLSLHYRLGSDLIRSSYWSKFLFRPSKFKLF